jgi:putative flippase GtrA
MTARHCFGTDVRLSGLNARETLWEGSRYLLASALALAVDAGTYVALIRLAGIHYLVSAPIGFGIGVILIYHLSTHWVFRDRRLSDARREFAIFVFIGILGLLLNELIIFLGVDRLALSYELAKVASAGIVFGFNFSARKLLLFTRL